MIIKSQNIKGITLLVIILTFVNCSNSNINNKISSANRYIQDFIFDEINVAIRSSNSKISLSNWKSPQVKISLYNFSIDSINIVSPAIEYNGVKGKPIIRWSVINKFEELNHPEKLPKLKRRVGICGDLTGLNMNQIKTLPPNSGITYKGLGLIPPIPKKVGKYGVKFYYKLEQSSKTTRHARPNKIYKIDTKKTQKLFLVSNELIFDVTE